MDCIRAEVRMMTKKLIKKVMKIKVTYFVFCTVILYTSLLQMENLGHCH